MRCKRKGFTLGELPVVIGIIAPLINLLLPTLSKARRSARSAACLSNLHQTRLAVNLYAVNNKGSTFYESSPNPKNRIVRRKKLLQRIVFNASDLPSHSAGIQGKA